MGLPPTWLGLRPGALSVSAEPVVFDAEIAAHHSLPVAREEGPLGRLWRATGRTAPRIPQRLSELPAVLRCTRIDAITPGQRSRGLSCPPAPSGPRRGRPVQ